MTKKKKQIVFYTIMITIILVYFGYSFGKDVAEKERRDKIENIIAN